MRSVRDHQERGVPDLLLGPDLAAVQLAAFAFED
jgi:hypothetical protein